MAETPTDSVRERATEKKKPVVRRGEPREIMVFHGRVLGVIASPATVCGNYPTRVKETGSAGQPSHWTSLLCAFGDRFGTLGLALPSRAARI
jgi:hypothetical protein